jgi:hypothetical protein
MGRRLAVNFVKEWEQPTIFSVINAAFSGDRSDAAQKNSADMLPCMPTFPSFHDAMARTDPRALIFESNPYPKGASPGRPQRANIGQMRPTCIASACDQQHEWQ